MFLKTASNAKHCEQNYILLSSGGYTGHSFLCSRSSLIALKRTYVCSVNLKALISNKVGSDDIVASSIVLSDTDRLVGL